MSLILFKRFLVKPLQVAYVFPSSAVLVRKVADKCDFTEPRVVVELGPGEGCHTRELLKRMQPGSRLLLFEIDPVLAEHLRKEFAHDPRVEVLAQDAASLKEELQKRGMETCDYVISGIPFSMIEAETKQNILQAVYNALGPKLHCAFIVYQCTHELKRHAAMFGSVYSEYCLWNLPPLFITVYRKLAFNPQTLTQQLDGASDAEPAPCCAAAKGK